MTEKLLIVDGSSIFFRAFYAMPTMMTKEGIHTNAVYGFLTMLHRVRQDLAPTHVAICFDHRGKTFRHDSYEDYKGTRKPMPSEFEQQWPVLREILDAMGITTFSMPSFEADDLAGSLGAFFQGEGREVCYVTGDRDYLQLVGPHAVVYLTKKGVTQLERYDEARIKEEYGLTPKGLIDLKGLMGDSSDNIPGVPKVGEKTGLKLLTAYGSIEGIYEHLDEISGKALRKNLEDYEAQAYMSRRLGTIVCHVPLEVTKEDLLVKDEDLDRLRALYQQCEFRKFLGELEVEAEPAEELALKQATISDLMASKAKTWVVFPMISGRLGAGGRLEGLGLYDTEQGYVVMGEESDGLRDFFKGKEIIGHDLKELYLALFDEAEEPEVFSFDTALAQYLLDPGRSSYAIEILLGEHTTQHCPSEETLLGKGKKKKSWMDLDKESLEGYLSVVLPGIWSLKETLEDLLKEQEMLEFYHDVEMPLTRVLAAMEHRGIRVLPEVLHGIGEDLDKELSSLEMRIYDLAGEEFNINSPKQLGTILFEKLGFPALKKTKTGYSTAVDVLEQLVEEGNIVEAILRYRMLSKLKGTYVDGMEKLIDEETGRIHSQFLQMATATGRLSSADPNLQNLPVRTEEGRLIRKAFVPEEGSVFVDGDYSQIELRILAHIAKDEEMQEIFQEGGDIHTSTAAQVFHLAPEEVTPLMRRRAKAVNFGIVYGISDYGLSRDLNIPRKEAAEYIDAYLHHFQGVKKFMEEIVEEGKEQGFVTTLSGRRRYIPELQSKNFNVRGFGQRIALNTPIQGSAADMMKRAMVRVYEGLKTHYPKARLLVQIHDELLIECPEEEAEELKKDLAAWMAHAEELEVPILVDTHIGKDWYDAK